ncbi:unnamed protein product [Prorocentrum cordatum]|uniref:Uncharacterized protein n=1 Tax=Prorocentrum cordatum TaxID=2364126 RepID=A0ABN9QJC4_9DINO|nr:unnamed protein product [Polarella glacialis]
MAGPRAAASGGAGPGRPALELRPRCLGGGPGRPRAAAVAGGADGRRVVRALVWASVALRAFGREGLPFAEEDGGTCVSFHRPGRTLMYKDTAVFPVGISIPSELVQGGVPGKVRTTAGFVGSRLGGEAAQYKFGPTEEDQYHAFYARHRFAVTRKKGGWDSLRHAEILAAGSVPLFQGLASAPPLAVPFVPRARLLEAERQLMPYSKRLEAVYNATVRDLLAHTRRCLTAESMAAGVLRTLGVWPAEKPLRLLFVTCGWGFTGQGDGWQGPVSIGLFLGLHSLLRKLPGSRIVDAPALTASNDSEHPGDSWDSSGRRTSSMGSRSAFWYCFQRAAGCRLEETHAREWMYGFGFSYARRLPLDVAATRAERARVRWDIRRHAFDAIIYGKVGPAQGCDPLPFLDGALEAGYPPQRIALIYGGDFGLAEKTGRVAEHARLLGHVGNVFFREMDQPDLSHFKWLPRSVWPPSCYLDREWRDFFKVWQSRPPGCRGCPDVDGAIMSLWPSLREKVAVSVNAAFEDHGRRRRGGGVFEVCWSGLALLSFPLLARVGGGAAAALPAGSGEAPNRCRFAARSLRMLARRAGPRWQTAPTGRSRRLSSQFREAFGVSMEEVAALVCGACPRAAGHCGVRLVVSDASSDAHLSPGGRWFRHKCKDAAEDVEKKVGFFDDRQASSKRQKDTASAFVRRLQGITELSHDGLEEKLLDKMRAVTGIFATGGDDTDNLGAGDVCAWVLQEIEAVEGPAWAGRPMEEEKRRHREDIEKKRLEMALLGNRRRPAGWPQRSGRGREHAALATAWAPGEPRAPVRGAQGPARGAAVRPGGAPHAEIDVVAASAAARAARELAGCGCGCAPAAEESPARSPQGSGPAPAPAGAEAVLVAGPAQEAACLGDSDLSDSEELPASAAAPASPVYSLASEEERCPEPQVQPCPGAPDQRSEAAARRRRRWPRRPRQPRGDVDDDSAPEPVEAEPSPESCEEALHELRVLLACTGDAGAARLESSGARLALPCLGGFTGSVLHVPRDVALVLAGGAEPRGRRVLHSGRLEAFEPGRGCHLRRDGDGWMLVVSGRPCQVCFNFASKRWQPLCLFLRGACAPASEVLYLAFVPERGRGSRAGGPRLFVKLGYRELAGAQCNLRGDASALVNYIEKKSPLLRLTNVTGAGCFVFPPPADHGCFTRPGRAAEACLKDELLNTRHLSVTPSGHRGEVGVFSASLEYFFVEAPRGSGASALAALARVLRAFSGDPGLLPQRAQATSGGGVRLGRKRLRPWPEPLPLPPDAPGAPRPTARVSAAPRGDGLETARCQSALRSRLKRGLLKSFFRRPASGQRRPRGSAPGAAGRRRSCP